MFPVPRGESWSGHQYRGDGALCLEYGPDNWEPRFTAASVINSLINLLHGEALRTRGRKRDQGEVTSRHTSTLGADLRNRFYRVIVTDDLITTLNLLQSSAEITTAFILSDRSLRIYITEIDGKNKVSEVMPKAISDKLSSSPIKGYCYKVDVELDDIDALLKDTKSVNLVLEALGFDIAIGKTAGLRFKDVDLYIPILFLTKDRKVVCILLEKGKKENIHCIKVYPIMVDFTATDSRIPSTIRSKLHNKSVAIIGTGSLGSKLARSLASSGITDLLLIDDDILLPENISRHIKGFDSIGEHKAVLVKKSAESVLAKPNIEVTIGQVGEQTNTSIHSKLLAKIALKNLIVDCTASTKSFQILSMVSSESQIPLLWGEVFPGGLGGLTASAIPKQTPCPFCVRRAILERFLEYPNFPGEPDENYSLSSNDEARTFEALDSDVSYVASVMAHRVISILTNDDDLAEDQPIMIFGLRKGWIFDRGYQVIRVPARQDDYSCDSCWESLASIRPLSGAKKEKVDRFLASIKTDERPKNNTN